MKQRSNFGYKFLMFIALLAVIANAVARDHDSPFDDPDPAPDSTKADSPLRFPIYDKRNEQEHIPSSIDLQDPSIVNRSVEYDADSNRYNIKDKMGDQYFRTPSFMTFEEYQKYRAEKDEETYWKRRLDALTLFNQKPELPTMYKEGIFDRIFGGNTISVRPQGNVDVTFGGNWQNIQNPTLPLRAQKYSIFDFNMDMNINLLAQVGDKLKLNISNNTKATFDYQNVQKLEYTGKEDEIIKKIEAGNISFPLKSSLVNGVQSLFGIKTQLQFGKLWVTGVLSQQRSKRQSLTIQGGSQTQQFAIKADDYEENRHFLLAQYFRANYNKALEKYPIINSQVTINKIEVWISNTSGATQDVRNIAAFTDLGEAVPGSPNLNGAVKQIPNGLPDNYANQLYSQLQQNPSARSQSSLEGIVRTVLDSITGYNFKAVTARKLNSSEFSFNSQLGYISLNTQVNPYDVLSVAYRYTYNGRVYQVGEFSEDLPPSTSSQPNTVNNQKVLFVKLLKSTSSFPDKPIWDLMMKNVYALGGLGVAKEDFRLNILYQDPGGGEKRYLPEGFSAGIPLLRLLNLDKLNFQNDPAPDGIFDFVEGITINTQQGKIIFPTLEPFGNDLSEAFDNDPRFTKKYLYTILYDSTKTIARQFQQNNRYVIKGSYKSSSSSEIFLGGFNIPQGSVSVSAGGQKLVENTDYQIDYGLGRLKILNAGILNSGIPINVQYEDNATFGFQQQNFMGTRLDYYFNNNVTIGGTFMRLTERPFTQKTTFGEDPIKNTVLGLDANYQSEVPAITRALDKLPIYSTTSPSFISASAEVAGLFPDHPQQIDALDPEGSVYIDDFEGTRSSYDLKFPANSWTLSSTPTGAMDKLGRVLFPESVKGNNLDYGKNRAKLAWYFIEPSLIEPNTGVPDFVKKDPNQHYIRLVQQQDVFPQKTSNTLQNALSTLDLAYFPNERGPYNMDASALDDKGFLTNPKERFGGIMRPIDNSDFEQSNVEFIEFWLMDPFIDRPNAEGGSLYINLGDVSEDVLKDGQKSFENGIPYPKDLTKLNKSVWGYTPGFSQQITRSFDNDQAARAVQDVGYDGLDNEEEKSFFTNFLADIARRATFDPDARARIENDPANDDYQYFRGEDFDKNEPGVIGRYKRFNGPHGNSPIASGGQTYSSAGTNIPEAEDINRDNTLNESEDYFQYRIDMSPNMTVGTNYIINIQEPNVKLPNGKTEKERWYQFKIPIREYTNKVGGITDFRSIRFMRMFLHNFQDSVFLRFARLELGRNNWRRYLFSLQNPGENVPDDDLKTVEFAVSSVSLEENSRREPVPYVIPPGVSRQQAAVATGQNIQLNEQALSLQVCGLKDGDARAVFKEIGVDMRQFKGLRMFIHAESRVGQVPLRDGDVNAVVRIGSDFINNYYEYQVPLKITAAGTSDADGVWPVANSLDLILDELVSVKSERNVKGLPSFMRYEKKDSKGNTIVVIGNPNIGDAKTIMLGIANPKKDNQSTTDDGLPKCAEVWYNELRMIGLNETPGYAASGKLSLQLADLGNLSIGGAMHTAGYGNIDQKLNQRFRDDFFQYNTAANVNLGKLMPKKWGVQLPMFVGYSENVSNPQYDPYDLDVKYKDKLNTARDAIQRDSMREVAQDYTSIKSINFSNVRILGNPEKQKPVSMPWSVKNFDVSYAYNKQFKRNPLVESDELINQKVGLGYTYTIKAKPIEPFKRAIKSKSKWLSLVKDFNLNLLPANLSFRTDLNRTFNETQVRNISDGPIKIEPTYFKNFLWARVYTFRWELTRSLSFDYTATNQSRIDEPYGRINTQEKKDTLWARLQEFGRNTFYTQNFNASYNVPLQKLPITDWTSLRFVYGANYSWTAASLLAKEQGNIIGNTQTKQINGELNFSQLYNKNRWLRAVNQPKPPPGRNKPNSPAAPGDQKPGDTPPKDTKKVRDLRNPNRNKDAAKPPVVDGKSSADSTGKKAEDSVKVDKTIENMASKLSDKQLDSFKKVQKKEAEEKAKAEKLKKKKERIAARKKKRSTPLEVNGLERFGGKMLTMVRRSTISFQENAGTTLPGYMDSTTYMGVNSQTLAPGFDFVYGYQPDRSWLEAQAARNRLSSDSLFNGQFQQQYSQNINIITTLEPIQDFRVDLSLTKTFSKTHSELYKDTSLTGSGDFTHNNPYQTGSFTVSYIGLKTLFKSSDVNSGTFHEFLENRKVLSERLGNSNPYTKGIPDPNNPNYNKGYTSYSQDVLIPSFIAAYSGKPAVEIGLVDNNSNGIRANPFKNFLPKPNWRVTYNGLSKIPAIKAVVNNLVLNHSYSGTLALNSFVSSLYYQDIYSLGFPSFIDSNSGNYVPFYQVPNITISEQFTPLLGFDAALKNNMTGRFEFRKSRTVSLSLVDYQVSETKSTEYVVGGGYRMHGLILPFEIFGVRKLKNDLNIKVDVSIRDDRSSNNFLAQNVSVTTRGQKVITISPSIDYIVSDKLTLRFFYDRRQSIPYVTSSYPIVTTRAGVTLRFIFAQ